MLQKMRMKDMDLSPVPPQGWWWNNEKEQNLLNNEPFQV